MERIIERHPSFLVVFFSTPSVSEVFFHPELEQRVSRRALTLFSLVPLLHCSIDLFHARSFAACEARFSWLLLVFPILPEVSQRSRAMTEGKGVANSLSDETFRSASRIFEIQPSGQIGGDG